MNKKGKKKTKKLEKLLTENLNLQTIRALSLLLELLRRKEKKKLRLWNKEKKNKQTNKSFFSFFFFLIGFSHRLQFITVLGGFLLLTRNLMVECRIMRALALLFDFNALVVEQAVHELLQGP
jgi:hypothetical protein